MFYNFLLLIKAPTGNCRICA